MNEEVRRIVEDIELLYRTQFGDLEFLEPGGDALRVNVGDSGKICFIQFDLPGKGPLHLKSISCVGPSGDMIDGKAASISASSHYGKSGALARRKALLDAQGERPWGVHTKEQPCPWVQVSFQEPLAVSALIVRNRPDIYASRAAGLRIRVSADGVDWRVVFDAASRARTFHSAARVLVRARAPKEFDGLGDVAAHIALSEYAQARQKFSALAERHKRPLQEAVNVVTLEKRRLEWTSHGAKRSFRFWSYRERVDYVRFALGVVEDLRAEFEDVCFGFGSVLAVMRDKDLIPHDDDMDIIVGLDRARAATISEGLSLVRRRLESAGYSVSGRFLSHRHVGKNGMRLDVFVGLYEEEESIGWFPGKRGALRREDVFPAGKDALLEMECPVPRRVEHYLRVVYGEDWRTPLPGWRHDWNREAYADIA